MFFRSREKDLFWVEIELHPKLTLPNALHYGSGIKLLRGF
jgi:hypothetical protein